MLTLDLNLAYLKAAAIIAPKADIRYYLCGVLVDVLPRAVRIVSTDGHRLACFHSEVATEEPLAPCQIIIPGDVLRGLKAANKNLIMLALRYDPEHPEKPATLTGAAGGDRTFAPVDGKYPDYSKIMPTTAPSGKPAVFNPYYVAEFSDLIRTATGNKAATDPHVYPNGNDAASVLHPSCPEFYGVIMPLRQDAVAWQCPTWLAPAPAARGPQ